MKVDIKYEKRPVNNKDTIWIMVIFSDTPPDSLIYALEDKGFRKSTCGWFSWEAEYSREREDWIHSKALL